MIAARRRAVHGLVAGALTAMTLLGTIPASGHTIWEYRPGAFDRALAEFVPGTATQLLPTDR